MAYFLVLCKCGHVGRRFYMPICFPVEAKDRKEAAAIARQIPRVKHDHKDAILFCNETDYEGFLEQSRINDNDPYLLCKSRHEQNKIMKLLEPRLVADPHIERGDVEKYTRRKVNLFIQAKRLEGVYYD